MITIYKYPIEITDTQNLELPIGCRILTAQLQNDNLWLWVLVDTNAPIFIDKTIRIFGTGNPIEPTRNLGNLQYLSTVQMNILVFHIFEEL